MFHGHSIAKLMIIFEKNDFTRSENELTLYVRKQDRDDFIIVYLYVNDKICMSSFDYFAVDFKFNIMKF